MTATRLRALTPDLGADSHVYVELPDGTVAEVEDARTFTEPPESENHGRRHLILITPRDE